MRVVICGGGVIGACTAYFLGLRQVEVVVVERTGVACAASGKSGGFLALDWCDGSALGRLARRSFNLHAELAADLDGSRWGYRRLDTWSVLAGAGRGRGGGRAVSGPAWLGESALVQGKLGTQATTAQVHPARFTEAMLQAAVEHGRTAAAGLRDRRRPRRRPHHGIGRQGRRRGARGRCHRHRHGAVVHGGVPMAAIAGGVRAQGQQRGVPERQQDLARRAVRRARHRRRCGAYAGGVPARRRHDLRLRSLQPAGIAGRPCRCGARPGGAGCAASDDPRLRTELLRTPRSWPPRPASGR